MMEQLIKYYRPKAFRSVLKQFQQDAKKLEKDGWIVVTTTKDSGYWSAHLMVVYRREKPPEPEVPPEKPKKKSFLARANERERMRRQARLERLRQNRQEAGKRLREELKASWKRAWEEAHNKNKQKD